MASNDPGLLLEPQVEQARPFSPEKLSEKEKNAGEATEKVVAPDQHDPRYEASRKEIWSYYSYYVGNK